MSFAIASKNFHNHARTTNGMKAYKSALNSAVDFFYNAGALRGRSAECIALFDKVVKDEPELALRLSQWLRDVRGGAGERDLFRSLLTHMETTYPNLLLDTGLLKNIPEVGRWDDLLVFNTLLVRNEAFTIISEALRSGNGLAAKWMPRKGVTAVELRNYMALSPKAYRKMLVGLTKVVESQMCAKEWDSIEFSHVPSKAMSIYSKAFARNATNSFENYKLALSRNDGTAKVNAAAVYPYEVVKMARTGDPVVADAMWDALPNYVGDANVMAICDVSGSMSCPAGGYENRSKTTCLEVSVSLGMYTASKNTGPFKDTFMTFAGKPEIHHLSGTLGARVAQMDSAGSDWGTNTNLEAAFDRILAVAIKAKLPASDMPKLLLVLSDMQFDQCSSFDKNAYNMIQYQYESAGYTIPTIVWWNLNSSGNTPATVNDANVALVSGFSPAILKAVLSGDLEGITPENIMMKAIMSDRYKV